VPCEHGGVGDALTTVLVPTYDAGPSVREAVESALAQTEPRLEVIVVDDASPTPTAGALSGIDDPRLRIVRHRRNRGSYAARNTALRLGRTPFVSQLDQDDTWEPHYLESILPCFDDAGIGLAYSNTHIVGHPTGHDDYIGEPSVHPMDRFPKFAEQNPVPSLTATIRTEALRGVGGYPSWLWGAGDWYTYAKLIMAGWRFAYVHEQLAHYRWPSPGSGKSFNRQRIERHELAMWIAFFLRHPLTPGPRRQIRSRLRREALVALGRTRRALPGYPGPP
jgi:glycosyltransferase involved in cell wall biosynthesis